MERSPGQNNVSLNVHKMFGVTEHLKMEFRWIGYDHGECGNGGGGALHEFDGGGRVIRYQLKFMF